MEAGAFKECSNAYILGEISSWTKGKNQLNFLDIAPHSEPEAVA
jgi:hypothetical protein